MHIVAGIICQKMFYHPFLNGFSSVRTKDGRIGENPLYKNTNGIGTCIKLCEWKTWWLHSISLIWKHLVYFQMLTERSDLFDALLGKTNSNQEASTAGVSWRKSLLLINLVYSFFFLMDRSESLHTGERLLSCSPQIWQVQEWGER